MYNILFVCYGNICRSPMAEMIFKDLIYKNKKRYLFYCSSAATSMEEYGNGLYPKAKETLENHGINIEKHIVNIIKKDDYEKYDYIICMDNNNYKSLINLFNSDGKNKIFLLRHFSDGDNEIEDPWYTDNFEKVYNQIYDGCVGLYNYLVEKGYKDNE